MALDRSELSRLEREKASAFHSWSAQSTINPLMVRSAQGVYVSAEDGTTYLDFSSQLVNTNLGHQHPSVVEAIRVQAATICTIAPQRGYESRYRTAELILDHSIEGASKVFFANGYRSVRTRRTNGAPARAAAQGSRHLPQLPPPPPSSTSRPIICTSAIGARGWSSPW